MDGYLAEIRLWAANFAPRNWAFCEGQILSISQYSALFSLLGTIYGGDGRTSFALPDLRSRVPVGVGRGPGLTDWRLGERWGSESHISLQAHTHAPAASNETATSDDPIGRVPARPAVAGRPVLAYADSATGSMDPTSAASSGQQGSVSNFQPSLGIHFIICINGIFPSRN